MLGLNGFDGRFMWLFWIVGLVVIFWALKLIIQGETERKNDGDLPLKILEERLAKREIDREEYERKKRILEQ